MNINLQPKVVSSGEFEDALWVLVNNYPEPVKAAIQNMWARADTDPKVKDEDVRKLIKFMTVAGAMFLKNQEQVMETIMYSGVCIVDEIKKHTLAPPQSGGS